MDYWHVVLDVADAAKGPIIPGSSERASARAWSHERPYKLRRALISKNIMSNTKYDGGAFRTVVVLNVNVARASHILTMPVAPVV